MFRRCGGLLVCVVGLLAVGVAVWGQEGRFSVQFENTPLAKVLDAFKRFDPNLAFSLQPDMGDINVTAALVDVTVDEALQIVLGQSGLMAVKDNGVYQIRAKPVRAGSRAGRMLPEFSAPVFRASGPSAAGTGAPAAGGEKGVAGATEKLPPLRLIVVKYADPVDMAWLFGGDVIQGGGMMGGGGTGGGYGSSGYGSSGYGSSGSSGYGSSGYGSSGYSGGSSRGSSRSSGSSRGGSSRSSGRSGY